MGPEPFVQVLARQRPAEVGEQAAREAVFAFGKADGFAGPSHGQFCVSSKTKSLKLSNLPRYRPLKAMTAQNRRDPSLQFVGAKGVAHVVVGAGI